MPAKKTTKTSATSGKPHAKPSAGTPATAPKSPKTSMGKGKATAAARKPVKQKVTTKQVQGSASFAEARTKAEQYAKDPKKLGKLFEEAAAKTSQVKRGPFGETWAYLQAMIRLIRAYAKGDYRDLSPQNLVVVVLAIVYFVSPIDLIPDLIPVFGLVDDALVVGWALKQVKEELDAFMAWELTDA